jgi:ribosomal protein S18 acetylase RimI-like enzyme
MMGSASSDPRKEGAIWVMDLKEPAPSVAALIAANFRRVGPECLPALTEAVGTGASASAEIMKRFQTGRRCYTAWVGSQVAAYGWVSFQEEYIGELNLWIHLQPGEAYIWDCVTLPAFRGQHLYSALLSYMLAELRKEPLQRVWIGANLDNQPSQKGIARAGFQAVADMVIARVLAMRLVWVAGRPDVPESLVTEARRVFLDNRDKVWLTALGEIRNSR